MRIKELIDTALYSVLNNISLKQNRDIVIKFIYLGLADLYSKFNLSVKSGVLVTNSYKNLYEIDEEDLNILLEVYDNNGNKYEESDVKNEGLFKKINYRSFLLTKPQDNSISYIYLASPKSIESENDLVELPSAMIPALLNFVGYMGNSTIANTQNSESLNIGNNFLIAYNNNCDELIEKGYKVTINYSSLNMKSKGFV